MIRLVYFFFAFLTAANLAAQSIAEKQLAYFTFDECNIKDDSGNGSQGLVVGDPDCVCGIGDMAFSLDGNNDSMIFVGPLGDAFTTSDFTIIFYINPRIIQNQGGSQIIMARQNDCTSDRAFWVRYAPGSRKLTAAISQTANLSATVTGDLDKDRCWQYIAIVRSNTRFSLYINGELKETKTTASRLDISANVPLRIASAICPLDQPFRGLFDELRIFNRALTQEDIRSLDAKADRILTSDTLIYKGFSFRPRVSSPCANQFVWTPSDATIDDSNAREPLISPILPTVYRIQINDAAIGCIARDSVVVNVIDPDTLDCSRIFVPNAFTPVVSPGRNDLFGISNPFAINDFISFQIYDRWGGLVFEAADRFDQWDGTFQGKAVNPGIYLFRLIHRCRGEEKTQTGTLTVLR